MRWWPMAATVAAAAFLLSLGAFILSPSVTRACYAIGDDSGCQGYTLATRSLVVGSGAILAASLIAGVYTALLVRANRDTTDQRPLVSVHARRRQ